MDSQQDLDQSFIKDLHLSRRTFNALHRRGVFTVGKLKELFQNNKLENVQFIGQKSINEVSIALNKFYEEAYTPVHKEKISDIAYSSSDNIPRNDIDLAPIEVLHLHASTKRTLIRRGIKTVRDLRFQTNEMLLNINRIGPKALIEIRQALASVVDEPEKHIPKKDIEEQLSPQTPDSILTSGIDLASIEILNLHASTRGALIKNGKGTIGDLITSTDEILLSIHRIGPKVLVEIRQALKSVIDEPEKYIPRKNIEEKQITSQANKLATTWAEIVQSFFESEKDNYTYILVSRFGFKPRKLEEIASELNITRERVRQIQEAATVRFLRYVRLGGSVLLLEQIYEILLEHGENISLNKFRGILRKERLLGEFSQTLMSNRIFKIDLFETLICWLNLLSDPKHTHPPVEFPVDIKTLINSDSITIKDSEKLGSISSRLRKKIKRKVYFTGGINIKEASKILSEDERTSELVLRKFNLKKIDEYWYSLKTYDAENDTSKIPLWTAGMKMLAVTTNISLDTFYDGLRKYASRFYPGIAPKNVVLHALRLLGFGISDQQIVSTEQSHTNILSQSEKSLVSAISKNDGVASFLEIAEEFFLQNLSLPAVSVTLKRSPIAEKVDEGFYKLRGTEISWQQIETAKKRQKRYSQDEEISHGLDGIVRVKLTINSYAYLTGVIGSYGIKGMTGSWSIIYNNESLGEAKIDESYLWGLPKIFKKLDIQIGDRIELAFNTWDRSLSVEKVNHGIT